MSERKEKWPAIGIDLGTKYSCVGVWQNGRIEIIPNDQNNKTTPSSVAFTDTMRLVGDAAADPGRLNPTNTIFDAKRMIGRKFDDAMVQNDMRLWPFKVIPSGEGRKPLVVICYKGEAKYFYAEEISAMILMKMKDTAEAYLDLPVKNAVVTVPANFNDSQRQATKDAGAIAGLNVLHILNEPTAAAIAYCFDNNISYKDSSKKNVMVFDLGGGTFDVSLVSIEKGNFTVKAVGGNTHLGGTDFDNNMVDYFVEEFKRKHNKDVSQSDKALAQLREACERAKRALSLIKETSVEVDCLFEGIDFTSSISRARFDTLNTHLFLECIQIVERCLKDAGIRNGDVDDILLVGGSTQIPKVQQLLQEFFNAKELCTSINPDEVVAYGAAVHAAALCGLNNDKDMVVVDVTPLSLGVKVGSGTMSVVIPKNTTIPTRQLRTLYAISPIIIPLYEGERLEAEDNNFLGVIELPPFFASTRSQIFIDVCFEIDINGILNVSAEDRSTRNKSEIKIIDHNRLTSIDVDIMMEDAKEYKAQEKKYKKMLKAKNKLEKYATRQRERIFHYGQDVRNNDKKQIWEAVEQVLNWLEQDSEEGFEDIEYIKKEGFEAAKYEVKLEALRQICTPLYSARYKRKLMAINALENYAYKTLELLSNNKQRIRIENMIKIKDEMNSVVDWLNRNNDLKDASNYEKKLKALQDFCGPIIASSSKSLIRQGVIEVGNIIGRPFHKRNSQEETIKLGKGNIHEKEIEAKRKEYNLKMANLDKIVEKKLAQLLKTQGLASSSNKVKSDEENLGDPEFVQYDFATLQLATRYFSVENKLGQGGFGTVYKGTLLNGEILAIKRLSATGGQGTKEFMTEARLLAKLQHRNLVKLMGFCSEGEEKLLVYEFMANSSLDSFLFDPRKRQKLDWEVRQQIIIGIARGLQYLHEDSRLTIIHRDLKPANILLDKEMNTKIADFGVAKLFEGTQKLANTVNIVGTLGYMAPEYMRSGEYSNKTDVYSFGIMLLEIVSSQRNRAPHNKDLSIRTWELWNARRSFEIADPMLVNNCSREEVMRSIQIGLLCVQPNPKERPTMSEVVLMLVADVDLPPPSPLVLLYGNY